MKIRTSKLNAEQSPHGKPTVRLKASLNEEDLRKLGIYSIKDLLAFDHQRFWDDILFKDDTDAVR